ncbi:MAG: hypothetical protein CMF42_02670 [Legionellales bacterium]|nr:hypothetical protein [Legionellales bacterium]OUX67679.1 MAG: hypothetical protein CBD38_01535 [bacterium TMED178]
MVSVVGAGIWGSALAMHLSRVTSVNLINRGASNQTEPGIIHPIQRMSHCEDDAIIIYAASSEAFPEVATSILKTCHTLQYLIIASKGFVWCDNRSMFYEEWLKDHGFSGDLGILSGPSFASEVESGVNTALNLATSSDALFESARSLLNHSHLTIHRSLDTIGVEICGAYKNIIAILVGWMDQRGLGLNFRYAVLVKALEDLSNIIIHCRGDIKTVYQFAGIGDLMLTTLSPISRNRKFGDLLGQGVNQAHALEQVQGVVEGVEALRHLNWLNQHHQCQSPFIELVTRLVNEGISVEDIITIIQS